MDSNYYFFLYCILYASNTLPLIKAHYSEAINLKFSANQQGIKSRFPLLSFYMGVDAHQTFGIGNLWPIFHDTIVPETEKNLAHIHTHYVNHKFALDKTSLIGDDKQTFKHLQYCFLLSIEHASKTFITNPVFTAQYLLENEEEIDDKQSILIACQYLLEEIKVFKNFKKINSNDTIELLESRLNQLIQKYNALEDALDSKSTVSELLTSDKRQSFFSHSHKIPEESKIRTCCIL